MSGAEDYIVIYLDPFGSKTTAYYFQVTISGNFDDGMILDDGIWSDNTWDAVWYKAVKVYPDRYEVEIKIPFKSIRYKKGLSEWGMNFKRYITCKQESDYWTEVLQKEGNKVSKYGKLLGINPQTQGYYFEVYPEGFVRYDKYEGVAAKFKPRGSLNVKWDISSQTTLNATALPDFAQIESDPFSFNLSRYPTYLRERRPFFLEGKDIFQLSSATSFLPLEIFYSRMIGKSVGNEPVPILGGLKVTHKSQDWDIGLLGTYTDSLISEPRKVFSTLRIKKSIFQNSDVGMLFSGMHANKDYYNYAFSFDGTYRSTNNRVNLQTAMSNLTKKYGWAVSSGYDGLIKDIWSIRSGFMMVDDSFDVNEIGYVPWTGLKKFSLTAGPSKSYEKGSVRQLFFGPGVSLVKEPGKNNWSRTGLLELDLSFRANWELNIGLNYGRHYEMQQGYLYRDFYVSTSFEGVKYNTGIGCEYSYTYNYRQGYPAYQGDNWCWVNYNVHPKIALEVSSNLWFEWDSLNSINSTTSLIIPRIDYMINKSLWLAIFSEFVVESPQANFSKSNLINNRIGVLFSWNFLPKSWLYIAFNDYRAQNEQGKLTNISRIGAIKVKYLFYF